MNSVRDWNYTDLKLHTSANCLSVIAVDVVIVDIFVNVANNDLNVVIVIVWFQDCQTLVWKSGETKQKMKKSGEI